MCIQNNYNSEKDISIIIQKYQKQESIEEKIGKIVLSNCKSISNLLTLPVKIRSLIKSEYNSNIPAEFGGKGFDKVIKIYATKHKSGVVNLINSIETTNKIRSDAYIALAKNLLKIDKRASYNFAINACKLDPVAYKLKWLAFRAYDIGYLSTSLRIFDILPENILHSESEKKIYKRIKENNNTYNIQEENNISSCLNINKIETKILKNENEKLKREITQQTKKIESYLGLYNLLIEENNNNFVKIKTLLLKIDNLQNKISFYNSQNAEIIKLQNSISNYLLIINGLQKEILEIKNDKKALEQELEKNKEEKTSDFNEKLELKKQIKLFQSLENKVTDISEYYKDLSLIQKRSNKYVNFVLKNFETQYDNSINSQEILNEKLDQLEKEILNQKCLMEENINNIIDNKLNNFFSYININKYIENGSLSYIKPWNFSHLLSHEYIEIIAELFNNKNYDLIIEFGFEYTTLIVSKFIKSQNSRSNRHSTAQFISLSSINNYDGQLIDIFIKEKLLNIVDFYQTPIDFAKTKEYMNDKFYRCENIIKKLSERYKNCKNLLILVDSTNNLVNEIDRYPAFPIIMKNFRPAKIDFLINDLPNTSENKILEKINFICETTGLKYFISTLGVSKGISLIEIK